MQSAAIHRKKPFSMLFFCTEPSMKAQQRGEKIPTCTNSAALQGAMMEQQGPLHPGWGGWKGKEGNLTGGRPFGGEKKKQPHTLHRIVKVFQKAADMNSAQLYFHCYGLFLPDQIFISYINILQLLAVFLLYFPVLSDFCIFNLLQFHFFFF